jgi:hypothetical protein
LQGYSRLSMPSNIKSYYAIVNKTAITAMTTTTLKI